MHNGPNMGQWLAVGRELHARFGLNPSINDAKGHPVAANEHWANELCPAIRGSNQGHSPVCISAGEHFARLLRSSGKPVVEECGAGMLRIAVPIFAGHEFKGSLGGCGKVCEGGDVDEFMIRKVTGLELEQIRERAASVASITWAEADEIVEFLEDKVRSLAGN